MDKLPQVELMNILIQHRKYFKFFFVGLKEQEMSQFTCFSGKLKILQDLPGTTFHNIFIAKIRSTTISHTKKYQADRVGICIVHFA